MQSSIRNLGIGIIFPDAVENARKIIRTIDGSKESGVVVLRLDQRRLTSSEAFKMFQYMPEAIGRLAHQGGGFNPESLHKGLDFYVEKMKRLQEEECVIIAFDSVLDRSTQAIRRAVNAAWEGVTRPEWDFDCSTGSDAIRYKCFFSPLIWEEIEKKAKELLVSSTENRNVAAHVSVNPSKEVLDHLEAELRPPPGHGAGY